MYWSLALAGPVQDARGAFAAHEVVEAAPLDPTGELAGYVAYAVAHSPAVRAAYARWDAQVHRIASARSLPQPMIGFGAFVQSVETRVGPQQARLSLEQALPWPGGLAAGGDAMALEAQAAGASLDATALRVGRDVTAAYWALWRVRADREVHRDHRQVLEGLASTMRARLATGRADLAALQQVELAAARLDDTLATLGSEEAVAEARLRGVLGSSGSEALATATAPSVRQPVAALEGLEALAATHPEVAALTLREAGATAQRRAAAAGRLPDLVIGADWILTGPAVDPTMPDSGKDAVMGRVGLRLPLWQGTVGHEVAAAAARADALTAEREGLEAQWLASLRAAHARVIDSARRVQVVQGTLLPQARTAHDSLLGQVAAGTGSVGDELLLQRDLLDLASSEVQALAAHETAWADLQLLAGGTVDARAAGGTTDEEAP